MKLYSTLLLLSLIALGYCKEEPQEKLYFPLKPGKPDQIEVSVEDVKCSFKFHCDGGSSEEWQIALKKESETEYTCFVGKVGPTSYMLFRDFEVSMEGVALGRIVLDDSTGAQLSPGTSWQVKDGKVVPGPEFKKEVASFLLEGAASKKTKKTVKKVKKAKAEL